MSAARLAVSRLIRHGGNVASDPELDRYLNDTLKGIKGPLHRVLIVSFDEIVETAAVIAGV